MSDAPGGPDWFKAQDGKWYPPATGANPQFANQKKKGGCLKVFLIIAAIIIVLIVLISIGASSSSKKTTKAAETTCTGKSYPDQQKSDICADASGTVTISGVAVTATPLAAKTDDIGQKALCTTVTIKNNSSKSQDYNVFNFKVQTPSGNVATSSVASLAGTLNSGTLIAGANTSGLVCTDDSGAGQYVFIYKPNPFEATRGTWLFTV